MRVRIGCHCSPPKRSCRSIPLVYRKDVSIAGGSMGFDRLRDSFFGVCAFSIPLLCESIFSSSILVLNGSVQALGKRIRAASHFASEFEKKETTV